MLYIISLNLKTGSFLLLTVPSSLLQTLTFKLLHTGMLYKLFLKSSYLS